jgi:hypothetical protein
VLSSNLFAPNRVYVGLEFRYSNNGTFTMTTTYGASASLTFNGTAVWIYGAKRSNHGPYNVTLDGRVYRDDGFYAGQVFQQVLFSAVGLDGTKPHTVSIVNSLTDATKPYLDVDFVSASVWLYRDEAENGFCGCDDDDDDGRLSIRWRSRMAMERLNSRILPQIFSILRLGGVPTQKTSRVLTVKLDSECTCWC